MAGARSAAGGGAPLLAAPESVGPSAASASRDEPLALPSFDSFSNEDAIETEQQRRLDLYGFSDMTSTRSLIPKSTPWNHVYFPTNAFVVGNFKLHLSSKLGDSWRALGEVRLLYLTNGATMAEPQTGEVRRTDTTVLDYAGFDEPIRWGMIRIERLWVEHEFSTLFKLQVGAFPKPSGIWNVDRGTPALIGICAPVAVANELFPAHQTGLRLYGVALFDPLEVGYHLTLSNARGPDYDRSAKYVLLEPERQSGRRPAVHDDCQVRRALFRRRPRVALEASAREGEFIMNDVAYDKNARPRLQLLKPPQRFQSDYRRWGAYGMLGYRTRFIQTMPYFVLEDVYAPDNPIVPPTFGVQLGLNIHPTPAVVLKVEFSATHFSAPGQHWARQQPASDLGHSSGVGLLK